MNELVTGFRYVSAGLRLITKPGIRVYVIIPFFINAVLFAGVFVYGTGRMSDLINRLSSTWSWLDGWVAWLLWPLFVIISLTIVFFCFSILANLIAAPFNGFLAEAVEKHLTGKSFDTPGGLRRIPGEIAGAIKSESVKFLYFILRALPLLVIFIIPFIQAFAPLIWFLFGAWMLALEYLDYPMGNNQYRFPQIKKVLGGRRQLAIGFGSGVLLLTMIPVLNFIAMPVAVAGATRLWTEQLATGACVPETGDRV